MGLLDDTSAALTAAAARSDSCVSFYSGGKDSRVVIDLAVRHFRVVTACYMPFLPGLACVEAMLSEARARWGVEVLQLPHWGLRQCLQDEIFCAGLPAGAEDLPVWKMAEVYTLAQHVTGAGYVLTDGQLWHEPRD